MIHQTKSHLLAILATSALALSACNNSAFDGIKAALGEGARCDTPEVLQNVLKIAGGDLAEKVFEVAGPETISSLEGTRQCRGLLRVKNVIDNDAEYDRKARARLEEQEDERNLVRPYMDNGLTFTYTVSPGDKGFFVKVQIEDLDFVAIHHFSNGYGDRAMFAKNLQDDAHRKMETAKREEAAAKAEAQKQKLAEAMRADFTGAGLWPEGVLLRTYDTSAKTPHPFAALSDSANNRDCKSALSTDEYTFLKITSNQCIVIVSGDQSWVVEEYLTRDRQDNYVIARIIKNRMYALLDIKTQLMLSGETKCELHITGSRLAELPNAILKDARTLCNIPNKT